MKMFDLIKPQSSCAVTREHPVVGHASTSEVGFRISDFGGRAIFKIEV